MRSFKQESIELIRNLPDDFALEEILYEVDVLEAFREGDAEVARGEYITQAELEERLRQWHASSGRQALPRASIE